MKTYKAKTRVYNKDFDREIERRVKADSEDEARKVLEAQWKAVNALVDEAIPDVETGMRMEITSIEEAA